MTRSKSWAQRRKAGDDPSASGRVNIMRMKGAEVVLGDITHQGTIVQLNIVTRYMRVSNQETIGPVTLGYSLALP